MEWEWSPHDQVVSDNLAGEQITQLWEVLETNLGRKWHGAAPISPGPPALE